MSVELSNVHDARGAQPVVLIVDDEPGIRKVIRNLANNGLHAKIVEAEDGLEAVTLYAQVKPDVVVTDIRMPGMDGVSLMRKLKDLDPSVPVILVTGYPSLDIAIRGMKEGASDFLTKPFRLDHVQVVLEKALRERVLLQENQDLREEIHRKRTIEQLNEKLHRRVKELSALYSLGETITSSPLNRDAILRSLVHVAKEVTQAQKICFLVSDGSDSRMRIMIQSPNGPETSQGDQIALENDGLLHRALHLKRSVLNNGHWPFETHGLQTRRGMQNGNSELAVPLMMKDEVIGLLYASGKLQHAEFDQQDLQLLSELAKRASLGLENNYLYESVFETFMATLKSLVSTIEARDNCTKEHSQRVTDFSVLIATELGCTPEQIDTVRVAGYLHDLGKLGVDDAILRKPGRLTEEEFNQIKAHPVIGENILAPIGFLPEERALIRHHHERWDGRGYPDGLKGDKIPLLARVLSLADTFDAMTSDRPYRPAMSYEEGYAEIIRCQGTQFDPRVVAAFQSAFPRWREARSTNDGDAMEQYKGKAGGQLG